MFEFFNDHDKKSYEYEVEIYKEIENNEHLKPHTWLEVGEFDGIKFFHFPTSICWTRFYGGWEELRDKLMKDFPKKFPDVKFYSEAPVSGIII